MRLEPRNLTPTVSSGRHDDATMRQRPPLELRVCENGVPAVRVGSVAGFTVIGEADGLIVMVTVPPWVTVPLLAG